MKRASSPTLRDGDEGDRLAVLRRRPGVGSRAFAVDPRRPQHRRCETAGREARRVQPRATAEDAAVVGQRAQHAAEVGIKAGAAGRAPLVERALVADDRSVDAPYTGGAERPARAPGRFVAEERIAAADQHEIAAQDPARLDDRVGRR